MNLFQPIEYPWRKFRIEIDSGPIRKLPNHSGICIRMNPINSTNLNETEFFGIVRVDSYRPDESDFGLKFIHIESSN